MIKTIAKITILICIVLAISVPISAKEKKITLKLGGIDNNTDITTSPVKAMDLVPTTIIGNIFKKIVESETNGNIKVKYFPNWQLGSEAEMLQSLNEGIIQGTVTTFGKISRYVPEVLAFEFPYLYRSPEIAYMVYDGPLGAKLKKQIITKMGVRVLGISSFGYYSFITGKKQIKSIDDIKGLKLRVMERPDLIKMVQSLGGQPVPMSWPEVYPGLQQGVIDGMDFPMNTTETYKIYEVQKYYFDDRHLLGTVSLNINEKFYQSLPQEYREIINYAGLKAITTFRGTIEYGEQFAEEILKKRGMIITKPTLKQINQIREKSNAAVIPWLKSEVEGDWIDNVLKAVKNAEKLVTLE